MCIPSPCSQNFRSLWCDLPLQCWDAMRCGSALCGMGHVMLSELCRGPLAASVSLTSIIRVSSLMSSFPCPRRRLRKSPQPRHRRLTSAVWHHASPAASRCPIPLHPPWSDGICLGVSLAVAALTVTLPSADVAAACLPVLWPRRADTCCPEVEDDHGRPGGLAAAVGAINQDSLC